MELSLATNHANRHSQVDASPHMLTNMLRQNVFRQTINLYYDKIHAVHEITQKTTIV